MRALRPATNFLGEKLSPDSSASMAWMASITARADGGRSSGFFARRRMMRPESAGGKSGFSSPGVRGVSVATARSVEIVSNPENAAWPVLIR